MDKEQAIEFVKEQISQLHTISDNRSFQSGYANGLMSAFLRADLLTVDEFTDLHDLLIAEIRSE